MEGDNYPYRFLLREEKFFFMSQHTIIFTNDLYSTKPDIFSVIHGSILRHQKLVCWLDACAFHLFLFVLERLSRKEIFYAPLLQGNLSYFAENIPAHGRHLYTSISLQFILKFVHLRNLFLRELYYS